MRRFLVGLGSILLILAAIVGVRTVTVTSRQLGAPPAGTHRTGPVDSVAVAQHLAEAVRFRTISTNFGKTHIRVGAQK